MRQWVRVLAGAVVALVLATGVVGLSDFTVDGNRTCSGNAFRLAFGEAYTSNNGEQTDETRRDAEELADLCKPAARKRLAVTAAGAFLLGGAASALFVRRRRSTADAE